jgi:hypothetical protein
MVCLLMQTFCCLPAIGCLLFSMHLRVLVCMCCVYGGGAGTLVLLLVQHDRRLGATTAEVGLA